MTAIILVIDIVLKMWDFCHVFCKAQNLISTLLNMHGPSYWHLFVCEACFKMSLNSECPTSNSWHTRIMNGSLWSLVVCYRGSVLPLLLPVSCCLSLSLSFSSLSHSTVTGIKGAWQKCGRAGDSLTVLPLWCMAVVISVLLPIE